MTDTNPSITEATNRLVDAFPPATRARLLEQSESLFLEAGHVCFRQGEPIDDVYFPTTAVVSIITTLQNGDAIECSTVGNEGTTGVAPFLGARGMANAKCISQIPGDALRVSLSDFQSIATVPEVQAIFNRYVYALLVQVGQAVACNRLHSARQRCARWLLMSHDRVGFRDEFPLTQEFLAYMLGVRRASVTVAAGELQKEGLITYKRGKIHIQDRAGLQAASCECYAVIRDVFEDGGNLIGRN